MCPARSSGASIKDKVARSGLMKLVSSPLYKRMTIRNCNTARKLLALMESAQ